jgi:hypothetical protein
VPLSPSVLTIGFLRVGACPRARRRVKLVLDFLRVFVVGLLWLRLGCAVFQRSRVFALNLLKDVAVEQKLSKSIFSLVAWAINLEVNSKLLSKSGNSFPLARHLLCTRCQT